MARVWIDANWRRNEIVRGRVACGQMRAERITTGLEAELFGETERVIRTIVS